MISHIKIENFKSIGRLPDLELKPLTLLVGPNASGKSSIMEAIALAGQGGNTSGELTKWPPGEVVHQRKVPGEIVVTTYFNGIGYEFKTKVPSLANQDIAKNPVGDRKAADRKLHDELEGKVFLISSVRGSVPLRAPTGIPIRWVGVQGEYLLVILAAIFGQSQNKKVADQVAKWADRFGVSGLNAGFWGDNQLGADYHDEDLDTVLSLALASAGAKQVLTVVTQLFWSPKRSIILIEEPEISLHPKAQIDVIELFAEAIHDDKQIIATTHSTLLVLGLGSAVQRKLLKVEDIAVYHVEKKSGIGTVADRLPINKDGYLEGWIPSFTKAERKLLRQWWKTIPEVEG